MRRTVVIGILAVGCAGAPDEAVDGDTDAVDTLVPLEAPPEGAGFQVEMSTVAPAFSEVWACAVYHLPTTSVANVNHVAWQQNGGTHHMTLSTVLGGEVGVPDGVHPCEDIYAGGDFMKNQVMMFGNQGSATGTLALPEGVAATLPAGIPIVHEVHYVNPTASDLQLYSRLNAWTIPDDEVVSGIWGGSVRDEFITLPASTPEHTEWTRCVMNRDVDVLFLASHMHARGVRFTIAPFDGTTVGDVIFDNDDWHDPKITQFDPPRTVPAGQGFEFRCTWRNDDSVDVTYGTSASDEMCNMAIVHTPFDLGARCEVVESSDGHLWVP